jgi:folate-dependent phosphoribosylglycinamide formyltransferase PurN
MANNKIIMFAGVGESTNIVYHAISKDFHIEKVFVEEAVPRKIFLRKRIKNLGFFVVVGQILFKLLIVPFLRKISREREREIKKLNDLNNKQIPGNKIQHVSSINSDDVIKFLSCCNPDIVIVNGTRIISKKILGSTDAVFINMHAGITPEYRGVHGAYWALVNRDYERCGVTVHLIDEGIDTGGVIYQDRVFPSRLDNFVTYPFLQISAGIPLIIKAINDMLLGGLDIKSMSDENSKLWCHPTILGYLYNLLFKGIK